MQFCDSYMSFSSEQSLHYFVKRRRYFSSTLYMTYSYILTESAQGGWRCSFPQPRVGDDGLSHSPGWVTMLFPTARASNEWPLRNDGTGNSYFGGWIRVDRPVLQCYCKTHP